MPQPRNPIPVFALGVGVLASALAAPDAAAAQACRQDGATALPMPTRAAGVCVGSLDGESVLVQRHRQGIFVVHLDAGISVPFEGDDRRIEVHGPSPRIVYCPSVLLDFASGAPGSDCLAAGPSLRPGPGALVGAGNVQASVRLDEAGGATRPTSSRVVASLVSAEGDRFDVTGSLRTSPGPGPGGLDGGYDRVELAYRSEEASSSADPEAGATSPERARRLARLMALDEEQWQAVELMLALTPGDWDLLQALVESGGASAKPETGAEPDAQAKAQGIMQILNAIVTRINAIRSNVDGLVSRIPDRPDVRQLVGQIDLGQLRGVMDDVRDTMQGLVDVARELRAGYDSFDAARFRQRLGGVLDDVERLTTLYQRLLCLDNPDLTPRGPDGELLRRLIDRVPGVVLFSLSKVLEAVREDWDTLLGDIVDAVPAELTEFCNDGVATRALSVDVESAICGALRPKDTQVGLSIVKADVAVGLILFRVVKNRTKEQIAVTAGASVVAGATVGTVVKNPVYEAAESWVERLENIKDVLEKVTDRRKDCLDADADIEGDLRDCAKDGCACSVPLSVLLDRATSPSYTYVARLVETRIDQAESAGVGDAATARTFFATAEDDANAGTPAGYTALCRAYGALLETTTVPVPGEAPEAFTPAAPSRRKIRRP